jgi:hypothetical protein
MPPVPPPSPLIQLIPSPLVQLMLQAAWGGMALGIVSGAIIGLFFHREDWMGGYGSFRRRLARLGHISFFGLAFVNLGFAFTLHAIDVDPQYAAIAARAFLLGAATMPTICFLSAWRKSFRHLFFIPVVSVMTGVICTLLGMSSIRGAC